MKVEGVSKVLKHTLNDLRTLTPNEERRVALRAHLMAIHGKVHSEKDSLSKLARAHQTLPHAVEPARITW